MGSLKVCGQMSAWTLLGLLCIAQSYSAEPQDAPKAVVAIDKNAELKRFPSEKMAVPGKPVPEAGAHLAYLGSLSTGIFGGGPGVLRLKDTKEDEVVVLLSGSVVVVSDDGKSNSFEAGDSFVIPKGFNGTYEMKTKMREIFVESVHK